MKKEIICTVIGIVVGVAIGAGLISAVHYWSGKNGSAIASDESAGLQTDEDTQSLQTMGAEDEYSSAQAQSSEDIKQVLDSLLSTKEKTPSDTLSADIVRASAWESNGKFYAQYDITVVNNGDAEADGWTAVFQKAGRSVTGHWNCDVEEKDGNIYITPVEFNKKAAPHSSVSGAGIIVESDSAEEITDFRVFGSGAKDEDKSSATAYAPAQPAAPSAAAGTGASQTPVANPRGRLHVDGVQLVDEAGEPVQLRGVSTHGLAWYPEYVNIESFRTLRDDWNANVIRLAVYTEEYGGYCSGGNREELKALVDKGVNYATQLGMYVIIDWHILNDNNPQTHKQEAIEFFREMSAKYAGYDNVIYEICNEPHYVSWDNDIKPYAAEVISAIRANDSNALILVGTNTWSQDVTDVVGSRLDDDNVMYVLHFYAATHKDDLRDKLIRAREAGIPVFISECSICDASGSGAVDYSSANEWLRLCNENNISFIAWSLSNKNETASLIRSDCSKLSGWSEEDLTDTGKWFRDAIRNR